jgi:hypothetical protein
MKTLLGTLIAAVVLAFALAMSALAAPHGDQAQCPQGTPRPNQPSQRSATGQANACGPNSRGASVDYTLAGA